MPLNRAQIEQILPHRDPMLLVDRVDEMQLGRSLTAVYTARCRAQSGTPYLYPLLIESLCQAAGILFCCSHGPLSNRIMLFGSIHSFRFFRPVVVNEELTHRVQIIRILGDTAIMSGTVWVGKDEVATVDRFIIALREPTLIKGPEQVSHPPSTAD